jgi:C4-type Zn-finger protein
MNFLRKVFGKRANESEQPRTFTEKEYVICPSCGAGYNTEMVMASILMKSPFMADMTSWTTKIICSSCRTEIWVSGSYNKVFGQPRPR